MKTIYRTLLAVALLAGSALAQDSHRLEVFGGYQFTRLGGDVNGNGWNASATANLSDHFGVTADFSGVYASEFGVNLDTYTYTVGPVLNLTGNETFRPFAHVLVGGFRANAGFGGFNASTNGFATMAGGGVDAGGGNIAFRVVQVDWLLLHAEGSTSKNNVRVSTGLVLRF